MKTRGATMVEYAVMLLGTSLLAMCLLKALGHGASFGAERAYAVLSTAQGGSAGPPRPVTGERVVKSVKARRAGVAQ